MPGTGTRHIPIVDYLVLDDGAPHLVAHECATCGALFLDRHNTCGRCGNRGFRRRRLSETGALRSFAIVHRSMPGVSTPYISVTVELDGGGIAKGNLLGVERVPAGITLGMKVRLTTFPAGTDGVGTQAIAFGFEPA